VPHHIGTPTTVTLCALRYLAVPTYGLPTTIVKLPDN
jgi:hypothetical protein